MESPDGKKSKSRANLFFQTRLDQTSQKDKALSCFDHPCPGVSTDEAENKWRVLVGVTYWSHLTMSLPSALRSGKDGQIPHAVASAQSHRASLLICGWDA